MCCLSNMRLRAGKSDILTLFKVQIRQVEDTFRFGNFEKLFALPFTPWNHSSRYHRTTKMMQNSDSSPLRWPKDVGILAMEIYIPRTGVSQAALGTYLISLQFFLEGTKAHGRLVYKARPAIQAKPALRTRPRVTALFCQILDPRFCLSHAFTILGNATMRWAVLQYIVAPLFLSQQESLKAPMTSSSLGRRFAFFRGVFSPRSLFCVSNTDLFLSDSASTFHPP